MKKTHVVRKSCGIDSASKENRRVSDHTTDFPLEVPVSLCLLQAWPPSHTCPILPIPVCANCASP